MIGATRGSRARINIVVSLLCQILTILCGIIVPQLMIRRFGSETYGATTSITQFLSYISLLEGGIGGVARAALYQPLAQQDTEKVSAIVAQIRRFFRVIGYVFVVYVLLLACSYKAISHLETLDWITTFCLVVVISISTFAQYFIGISYSILLQASQKQYITNALSILTTVLNTVLVVMLVRAGCGLITVKLASSCVFVLKPVISWLYVRRHFQLKTGNAGTAQKDYLQNKWEGLGQHIAYFLHTNTDVAVLTVCGSLTSVAVYSVYNMVVSHMQSLTNSFTAGMEALFGDMLAKGEMEGLHHNFDRYETMISMVTVTLFSACAVLLVPFIRLYTKGITDADYIAPVFGFLLVLAAVITCLRTPYHYMVIASGQFRQTRAAAYGEAVSNIVISVVLVLRFGMVGVAAGTVAATLFRWIYYVGFLSRHVLFRRIRKCVRRQLVNIAAFSLTVAAGMALADRAAPANYLQWGLCAVVVTVMAAGVVLALNLVFYRPVLTELFRMRKR